VSVGRVVAEVGLGLALVAAYAGQMLRWLRVLQREHYEPSSMRRFLGRWSTPPVVAASAVGRTKIQRPITLSHVLAVGLVVCVVVRVDALVVLFSAAYGMFCPMGLSIKGRTSALQWTRRLTTIAVVASVFSLVVAITGVWTVRPWLLAVAMVWAVPLTFDLSVRALGPYEHRRA